MRTAKIRTTDSGYDARVITVSDSGQGTGRVALHIGGSYHYPSDVRVSLDDKERIKLIAALMDDHIPHLVYVARMVSNAILCSAHGETDDQRLDAIRYLLDHHREIEIATEPLAQAFCTLHNLSPGDLTALVEDVAKG